MEVKELRRNQFAIRQGLLTINATSLQFIKNGNDVDMILKMTLTPHQVHSGGAGNEAITIGKSGVFTFGAEVFDNDNKSLTLGDGTGDRVKVSTNQIVLQTTGDKGDHFQAEPIAIQQEDEKKDTKKY